MVVAVVLSAGESRRMGSPKALLRFAGKTFLEHIVASLAQTKVERMIVVVGRDAEEIRSKLARLPVTWVVNNDYAKGQLSSLVTAIRRLQEEGAVIDGILVHLVDHPLISPELVDRMIARFYESKKLIVLPRHKGKRGHPVIFSKDLFAELMSAPLEQGAKAVVHAHRGDTLEVETDEAGITVDIDTQDEYRKLIGRG
ncbi:MAG: nucleotidyltransferase family protein [Deltaproteobacteria bacterium]|nr:nucleotidyltransferase family protein [Deltaproteobacteria bacterium]